MSFEKPKLFYNNTLRDAQTGNDGTAYATCAEAVADPDDPNKVRGDIRPAADVPNLAALEGSGIVFDTTKNEYRIVDSEAAMRKLSSSALLGVEGSPSAFLIDGSYLIVACSSQPGVVAKYAVTDFSFVAQISLTPNDEIEPTAIVKYGTDYFVACRNSSSNRGVIVRINSENFTRTDALTINSDELYPTAMIVYGTDIFVACRDGSNTAKLVRLNAGTSRTSVLTLTPTSETYPTALVVYGTDIFVACRDGSNTATLVRTAAGLSRTSALVLTATSEIYPTALVVYGTDIFVACRNASNTATLVRCASGTSRTSALVLTPTSEVYPTALVVYGTDIFVACVDGSNTATLVRCASGTSRTSALVLTPTSEGNPTSLLLSGTDILVLCADTGMLVGAIVKTAGGTSRTSAVVFHAGEFYPSAILAYGSNIFVACRNIATVGVLVCLSNDLTRLSALTLNSGELYPTALVAYGTDIFVACRNASNTAILVRCASGTSRTSALVLTPTSEVYPTALVVYGTDIFVACRNASNTATLVRTAAGLSRTSALVLTPTSEVYPTALLVYGTDIFVACRDGSNTATLVRCASGTSRTSALVLTPTSETYPTALAVYGTDIFVACRNGTNIATLVRTAGGLSRTSVLTFNAGEAFPSEIIVFSPLIYVICQDSGTGVAIIVSTREGTARISALTIGADDAVPSGEAAAILYNTHIIMPVIGVSYILGRIVTIDPLLNFNLFSRLQSADIGDSFTIRAGLSCAQADMARPVDYAADGHLSPRMKGTLNTEHKIRIHAPNLIEDGGFESGAFLPDWTAGANWAIDATNELEGQCSAKWDTAADNNLTQARTEKLIEGRSYRLMVKAKSLTGSASAGALTIRIRQGSTDVDGDVTGTQPVITTTAAWFDVDLIPDFTTDRWELQFVPALANKGSSTGIIIDEIYLYEKRTVNSLIVGQHNWNNRGAIVVKAWRLSPLRSTAGSDANNYTQIASFTPTTADVILQTLTSSVWPVYEITLPAASDWTPEAGDIYLGDYWQLPKYAQSFDPYGTGDGDLREMGLKFNNLPPAYRPAQIESLFMKLRANEGIWVQHDVDDPLLMEDKQKSKQAPYNPHRVDLSLDLIERL